MKVVYKATRNCIISHTLSCIYVKYCGTLTRSEVCVSFLHKDITCNARNLSQDILNCRRPDRATFVQDGEEGKLHGEQYFSASKILVNGDSGYPKKVDTDGHVTTGFGVTNICQIIFLAFFVLDLSRICFNRAFYAYKKVLTT